MPATPVKTRYNMMRGQFFVYGKGRAKTEIIIHLQSLVHTFLRQQKFQLPLNSVAGRTQKTRTGGAYGIK